ncbi:MAG: HAD hydrolase-like protein [Rickettsiales bacterium]|jgi:4-nitrophenyl phosphatase|nr:HAD hydrolase-like protein [Rickettsiales bacterium]
MNNIRHYSGLLDIENNFDIFVFDAYGVFYKGDGFFENSLDVMKKLVSDGKIVCVLSNSPKMSEESIESYDKKGLIRGIHYTEFISSGTIVNHALNNNEVKFKTNPNAKNVYVCSDSNKIIFKNTDYNVVNDPKDSDFILLSSLPFDNDEYEMLKNSYGEYLFYDKMRNRWRATILEPYCEKLDNLLSFNVPFLNPNPDYSAAEHVDGGDCQFLITQGSFAKYLKDKGAEVIEIGKPYEIAYNYLFDVLEKNNVKVDKERTCMIGDTVRTDVKGANNAGIKSVLCIKTGVTAKYISDGGTLEELIAHEKVIVDYTINSVG